MKIAFTISLYSILNIFCYSQDIDLIGETRTVDGESLPFVTLKHKNNLFGTISNSNGIFDWKVKQEFLADTLEIFRLGYHTLLLPIKELLLKKGIVILHEDATKLEELIVSVKKTKPVTLGNQAKRNKLSVWESTTPGAEMGIRLNIVKPTYLNSVHLLIAKNECDTVFLRLNLYNLSKDSIGENIFKKEHILILPQKVGILKVGNFTVNIHKPVLVQNDVLITFQYIDTKKCKGNKGLILHAVSSANTFAKKTMTSPWQKLPVGAAITVQGSQEID